MLPLINFRYTSTQMLSYNSWHDILQQSCEDTNYMTVQSGTNWNKQLVVLKQSSCFIKI